ncbi:MAG TPA: arginase family protein [Gemmatimonadales bacterium]|nr:arginase family protein [Gemmatimonadales bacterium]
MPLTRIALIGVPSSAGGRRTGQEMAPTALRGAHLVESLRATGLDVTDSGDLAPAPFRADPDHPRNQNLPLVVDVARQVADQTDRALADARVPLVVGGDCSLSLGVMAGLLRHHARLGLVYFDADLDLNTPETTQSGIFDGMVLAHALGAGAPELSAIGPRVPMLSEADIVLFGYDLDSGWIDPYEIEALNRSEMSKYPLALVRDNPAEAARDALRGIEGRTDAVLIHFDVDVTNLPAVDVPHPGGLEAAAAFTALKIFASAQSCAAVVVTEFNAELDPDGSHAEHLVAGLARALAP